MSGSATRSAHRERPRSSHHFAPPTLETVVVPRRPADKGALHVALAQLAEQDPLINLRQDDVRQELFVSLYGEVQKEVIQATLANDFGIDVEFRETTTICIERPIGTGAAVEIIGKAPNPFLATVGLRIEPAPIGTGVEFRLEVELGSMPLYVLQDVDVRAVRHVRETLQPGPLRMAGHRLRRHHDALRLPAAGHEHCRRLPQPDAAGADERAEAGRHQVCEPIHRFHLEIPARHVRPLLPVLARLRAVPQTPAMRGPSCVLEGEIPAARVHELQQQLPALTRGEGVLEIRLRPLPAGPRHDPDPAAVGPQPAQPQGIPAAREAPELADIGSPRIPLFCPWQSGR